jgi:phosphatidylinositol alpha-1,6-mannosyltransferase
LTLPVLADVRILLVTPDFPPATGGIQLLMERLPRHLGSHEVEVMTLRQRDSEAFDNEYPRPVSRVGRGESRRVSLAALNAAALWMAARFRPDIVLSGHVVCGPGALAARAVTGAPVAQYVYAMELGAHHRLTNHVLTRADAVIAISEHTAGAARAHGARTDAVHVIHPGVDRPPPLSDPPTAPPVILTVARLDDRYKGFDVMLRALPLVAARVPTAQWVVIGAGRLRAELEATAAQWGLTERVHFLGALTDADRDAWLRRAHVFAMPSRLSPGGRGGEGFGLAYLEAGRYGVPVVAGAAGGALDAVVPGETGFLVDPADYLAVADAIVAVISEPQLRDRLARGGHRRAAELTWERMAGAVDAVLRSLVER